MAADFGGPEFDPHSAEALRLLLALVAEGRAGNTANPAQEDDENDEDDEDNNRWENGAVTDNAISAAFRVVFARPGPVGAAFASSVPISAVVGSLLDALPIVVDVEEAHLCHRRVVDHALSRHELFFGGGIGGGDFSAPAGYAAVVVPKLMAALVRMVRYQPSPEAGDAAAAAAAAGGGLPPSYVRGGGGGDGAGDSQEEMWARQLVDKETRQKVEEVLVRIGREYQKVFEETWAGLGEERRRALPTTAAEACAW